MDRDAVAAQVGEANADAAIEWGFARAKQGAANLLACDNEKVTFKVWTQPGTAMILVTSANDSPTTLTVQADLAALGVDVPKLWASFAQCLGGTLNVPAKTITLPNFPANTASLVFIDTFGE